MQRKPRVSAFFDENQTPIALDLLEHVELAWHDCYDEITPSEDVIDDLLTISGGSIDELIEAARLAVTDPRDLKLAAEARRGLT